VRIWSVMLPDSLTPQSMNTTTRIAPNRNEAGLVAKALSHQPKKFGRKPPASRTASDTKRNGVENSAALSVW
jgi:hypothetical protein